MRVPVLINVSAAVCAAFSLLGLIPVVILMFAAPGYFATLAGGPKSMLILFILIGACGLLTAVGMIRRREWARKAVLLLACIWMVSNISNVWALASKNASAPQFIIPACELLICAFWLLFFNTGSTRASFSPK